MRRHIKLSPTQRLALEELATKDTTARNTTLRVLEYHKLIKWGLRWNRNSTPLYNWQITEAGKQFLLSGLSESSKKPAGLGRGAG